MAFKKAGYSSSPLHGERWEDRQQRRKAVTEKTLRQHCGQTLGYSSSPLHGDRKEDRQQWRRRGVTEETLRTSFRQSSYPELLENISLDGSKKHPEALTEDETAFLKTIFPPDELSDDPVNVKLYESAAKDGVVKEKTIRVMLVGCFKQGKTTLARRLAGEKIHDVKTTDGIDVYSCVCEDVRDSRDWVREPSEHIVQRRNVVSCSRFCQKDDDRSDLSNEVLSEPFERNKNARIKAVSKFSSFEMASNSTRETLSPAALTTELSISEPGQSYSNKDGTQQIRIWDFGGQYVYYATHQLFHSRKSVYLLVLNLSWPLTKNVKDEDYPGPFNCKSLKEYIIFWMHSIHAFVGSYDGKEPMVILVGTHKDKLTSSKEAAVYFESVRKLFKNNELGHHIFSEAFALSLLDTGDSELDKLKRTIIQEGNRPNIQQDIPDKWICLEAQLSKLSCQNIVTLDDVLRINSELDYPLENEEHVKLFLKYYHEKGIYFFFDEGELARVVVLRPQFVIDAFKCLIKSKECCRTLEEGRLMTAWQKLSEEAVLLPELFKAVWKESGAEYEANESYFITLLKKHRIIAEILQYNPAQDNTCLTTQGQYIVPSLLKYPDSKEVLEFLKGKKCSSVAFVYHFYYIGIVQTLFQRVMAAAIGTWKVLRYSGTNMVFENVGIFEVDMYHAALVKISGNEIQLLVIALCPEDSVLFGKGDNWRRFVDVVLEHEFRKLQHSEANKCPPCDLQIKCYNVDHKYAGSIDNISLNKAREAEKDVIPCPDNRSHSLTKKQIEQDWFHHENTNEFPAVKLNEKDYAKLSQAIGNQWKQIGLHLGIDNVELQHIEMDSKTAQDKVYNMLLRWDRKQDKKKTTFDVLAKVLLDVGKEAVTWDKVYNLRDELKRRHQRVEN